MVGTPELTPYTKMVSSTDSVMCVMDRQGGLITLPYDLRLPFARLVARQGIQLMKRSVFTMEQNEIILFCKIFRRTIQLDSLSLFLISPDAGTTSARFTVTQRSAAHIPERSGNVRSTLCHQLQAGEGGWLDSPISQVFFFFLYPCMSNINFTLQWCLSIKFFFAHELIFALLPFVLL